MKIVKTMPIFAILLIGVMSSCDSDMAYLDLVEANSMYESQSKSSHFAGIELGDVEDFAILSK